jgi:UDP-glucose 4-epimerase
VTGGAGFIGSHIADRLVGQGARVRVLDNLSTGTLANVNLDRVEFVEGDVTDEKCLKDSLQGVDLVFHEAAQINPARAVVDPLFDFRVNAEGTLKLVLACIQAKVKKFVMACTNVYGNANVPAMSEDLPTLSVRGSLLSPYAASKVAAEAYLKVANDELGLPTVRLRYFNVFGPRQITKSESGVIAIFAREALAGKPLQVFGDGEQTRDFVYIDDVVEANILAATVDEASGGVFNVGTGVETSINAVAMKIRAMARADVPILHNDLRAADFRRARADLTTSRRVLGFEPRIGIDEGLKRYVEWCRRSP